MGQKIARNYSMSVDLIKECDGHYIIKLSNGAYVTEFDADDDMQAKKMLKDFSKDQYALCV